MKKIIISFVMLYAAIGIAAAQTNTFPATGSAAVGTTTPDASSLFEVRSTTKGMLVPRMTLTQRNAIATPATGLLMYQTNSTPGFYYYSGSAWTAIKTTDATRTLNNLTSPTAINQALLPGTDNTRDLGSVSRSWRDIYFDGSVFSDGVRVLNFPNSTSTFIGNTANTASTGSNNTVTGYQSMLNNGAGSYNTATGSQALSSNTTGYENTANGYRALYANTSGSYNSATGFRALHSNTTANYNTANGHNSLYNNSTGTYNSALGAFSLYVNSSGNYNTASGVSALHNNTTGSYNTANGTQALYSNTIGNYNCVNGYNSLYSNTSGSYNTSSGNFSLYSNTTGISNTATGNSALYSNTIGNYNTASGLNALRSNTNGSYNTASGYEALYSNTEGVYNTASGYDALRSNINGNYNTAHGGFALYASTAGSYNTAVGYYALNLNTSNRNTAVGYLSLGNTTSAQYNTAIGWGSGDSYNHGWFNTFIGADCDANQHALTNSIALGNIATVTANSQTRIGNSSTLSTGAYTGWTNISDGRYKKNIKEDVKGIDFIMKLRPVTYNLDVSGISNKLNESRGKEMNEQMKNAISEKEKIIYSGFVAQEVEQAAKELGYDFSGVDKPKNENDLYGLRYAEFVVPLVKAVQELNAELKMQNAELIKKMEKIQAVLTPDQQQRLNEIQKSTASLEQNAPNPFNKSTVIKYYVPENFSSAQLKIYSAQGVEIKSFSIKQSGKGEITVEANALAAGIYTYTLIVDDIAVDLKQMIVTR